MDIRSIIRDVIEEQTIVPPDIPDSQNFWHGGNLDSYKEFSDFSKGRVAEGPGLYLTTNYSTARDYSKGSRRLYMVTVQNGTDIADARISQESVLAFIKAYVIGTKRNIVKEAVMNWMRENGISAQVFNNILLNESAMKPANLIHLREFYVQNGIDYLMTKNIHHNGRMMVLFNMNKILKVQRILPTDKIEVFEF